MSRLHVKDRRDASAARADARLAVMLMLARAQPPGTHRSSPDVQNRVTHDRYPSVTEPAVVSRLTASGLNSMMLYVHHTGRSRSEARGRRRWCRCGHPWSFNGETSRRARHEEVPEGGRRLGCRLVAGGGLLKLYGRGQADQDALSLIHISEPTRRT